MKTTITAGLLALMTATAIAPAAFAQGAPERGGRPNIMAMLDLDGDGQITRAEAEGAMTARFAEADIDENGTLSLAEMQALEQTRQADRLAERFQRMDANGNGEISVDEMPQPDAERMTRMFDRADADGDGVISAEELAQMEGPRGHGKRHGKDDRRDG